MAYILEFNLLDSVLASMKAKEILEKIIQLHNTKCIFFLDQQDKYYIVLE